MLRIYCLLLLIILIYQYHHAHGADALNQQRTFTNHQNNDDYYDYQYDHIVLGGLFRAVEPISYLDGNGDERFNVTRNEIGSLHVQAFVMAIDEINNKEDGILDDLLPTTSLHFIIELNQLFTLVSEANYLYDGVVGAQRFKNTIAWPIHGSVIGTSDATTDGAVDVLDKWKVPMILSNSSSTAFSHHTKYEYVIRLPPSETLATHALYHILRSHQWSKIAMVYTLDTFGQDCYHVFRYLIDESDHFDIDYLVVENFIGLDFDLTHILHAIKDSGATIIMLFMYDASAAYFISKAHDYGLLSDEVQVLGTAFSSSLSALHEYIPTNQISHVMKGYITVRNAPELYFQTDSGEAFLDRFRALQSTMNSDGLTCDSRRDDMRLNSSESYANSNYVYKYASIYPSINDICLGFNNFSTFAANGSDLDATILYTYTAVQLYATMLHAMREQSRFYPMVGGDILYNELIQNTTLVNSAIGNVTIFDGIASYDRYGFGDRLYGHLFKILNFNEGALLENPDSGMVSIGYWNDPTIEYCFGSSSAFVIADCHAVSYRTSDNSVPIDERQSIHIYMSSSTAAGFIFLGILLVIMSIVSILFYFKNRFTKTIRNAQRLILYVQTTGLLLGGIRIILAGAEISHDICEARLWTQHLAAMTIISSLTLKMARINSIVNTVGIHRVVILERNLVMILAGIIVLVMIPLTIISIIHGSISAHYTTTTANQTTYQPICGISHNPIATIVVIVIYLMEVSMIIIACVFVWLTKDVPNIVNETYLIAPLMVFSILVVLICALYIFIQKANPVEQENIVASAFAVVGIVTLAMYNYGKYTKLMREFEKKKQFVEKKRNSISSHGTANATVHELPPPPPFLDRKHAATQLVRGEKTNKTKLIMEQIQIYQSLLVKFAEDDSGSSNSRTNRSSEILERPSPAILSSAENRPYFQFQAPKIHISPNRSPDVYLQKDAITGDTTNPNVRDDQV